MRLKAARLSQLKANETLSPIHHRMPVMLAQTDWADWLETPAGKAKNLQPLLTAAPEADFEAVAIDRAVNKLENDSSKLWQAVDVETKPREPAVTQNQTRKWIYFNALARRV